MKVIEGKVKWLLITDCYCPTSSPSVSRQQNSHGHASHDGCYAFMLFIEYSTFRKWSSSLSKCL